MTWCKHTVINYIHYYPVPFACYALSLIWDFFWSKVQALNGPSTKVFAIKFWIRPLHCFHIWFDLKHNFIKKKLDHKIDRRISVYRNKELRNVRI